MAVKLIAMVTLGYFITKIMRPNRQSGTLKFINSGD